jgi:hypothetical protein
MCGLVNVHANLQSVGLCVLEVILWIYPGLVEAQVDYNNNNNNNNNLQFSGFMFEDTYDW